jgi:hypothetical protein
MITGANQMTNHKHATYLNTNQFSWDKGTLTLSAEASEIEMDFCLFDTLNIKSQYTGELLTFDLRNAEKDRDGEIIRWIYAPSRHNYIKTNLKVIIYND